MTQPGGADPAGEIADLILAEVSRIDALTLQACDSARFDAWLSSVPASINDIDLPEDVEFDLTITVPPPVEIDIKPNSDPSSFGCKAKGSIPVAVLGTEFFDATTIDANTVLFGATGIDTGEVHRNKKTGDAKRHVEDYNDDGFLDMIFHFGFAENGFG